VTVEGAQNDKRSRIEHLLAECRTDRQRLISENAALLLRALTAEDAFGASEAASRAPAQDECSTGCVFESSVLPQIFVLPSL
jgi:hypothetical protein